MFNKLFYNYFGSDNMDAKRLIVEAYLNLVIKEHNTNVTVKEICSKADVSRTTFYKYFKDSYNIIEHIFIQDAMYSLEPLVNCDLSSTTIMENWYLSFYRHKEFYLIAIKENGQNSLFDTVLNVVEEYNRKLFEPYASDDDLDYYSYKYSSLQAMLLKKWMIDGMKVKPEKIAKYFTTDFIKDNLLKK